MKPAHIILIEDNPGDRLLVKLALDEQGLEYELVEFDAGVVAVQELCRNGESNPIPDAILMDLNTPRSDGFEVVGKLRQQFANVPIMILTSSRARADRNRAALLGVKYVEKESDLKTFLSSVGEAVKEMLEPQQWLPAR
jgi:CheY-like chemotaxis protein